MFLRDVNNMRQYYSQFAPSLAATRYGDEIWAIFESGDLTPDSVLTGKFTDSEVSADVDNIMNEINAAREEELDRLDRISNPDD